MFDRMPKIVGVTWSRPRPLSGKIIYAPARHPHTKPQSSNSFRDIALYTYWGHEFDLSRWRDRWRHVTIR